MRDVISLLLNFSTKKKSWFHEIYCKVFDQRYVTVSVIQYKRSPSFGVDWGEVAIRIIRIEQCDRPQGE